LVSKERDAAEFSWLSLRLSSPALGEAAGKLEVPRPRVVGTYRVLAAVGGAIADGQDFDSFPRRSRYDGLAKAYIR